MGFYRSFLFNVVVFILYILLYLLVPLSSIESPVRAIVAIFACGLFYASLEASYNKRRRDGPVLSPARQKTMGTFAGATFGLGLEVMGGQPFEGLAFAIIFFGLIGLFWERLSKIM